MPKRSPFGSIQYLGEDRYRVWWTDDGKRRSKVVHGTRDDAELFLATKRLGREDGAPDQLWASYYATRVKLTFDTLEPKTVSGYTRVWDVELKDRIGDSGRPGRPRPEAPMTSFSWPWAMPAHQPAAGTTSWPPGAA